MKFKADQSAQKLRGGYYTPEQIASFLVRWAMAGGARRVLEPSCGDGRFIEALLREIQSHEMQACQTIHAVEIIEEEANKASGYIDRLVESGVRLTIDNADFFYWINNGQATSQWDAAVGNPPYIRYQFFEPDQQERAEKVFEKAGVSFTRRTNAWVPFLIASITHLAPGGRLAFVIPAEIMHIHHAHGLRLLLEKEMESIILINMRDLVFENADQGIVLLLAQKRQISNTGDRIAADPQDVSSSTLRVLDIEGIQDLETLELENIIQHGEQGICFQGDWMKALLSKDEVRVVESILTKDNIKPLIDIADVDIGIVTGANNFFVVGSNVLNDYDLHNIAYPMLAKSECISGIIFTNSDHEKNVSDGKSVHLLQFPCENIEDMPVKMAEYLAKGVKAELPLRRKCGVRKPWYVITSVWASEVSLLKRCHIHPKMVLNEAMALSTDTAYRIKMRDDFQGRGKDLTFSFMNSLSFLYAELLGRHYSGGVLELVPSEIERIPIPLMPIEDTVFQQIDSMVRSGCDWKSIVEITDRMLLIEGMGLTIDELTLVRQVHRRLMYRRMRREPE